MISKYQPLTVWKYWSLHFINLSQTSFYLTVSTPKLPNVHTLKLITRVLTFWHFSKYKKMLRAVRWWAAEDTHLGLFGYIHSKKVFKQRCEAKVAFSVDTKRKQ